MCQQPMHELSLCLLNLILLPSSLSCLEERFYSSPGVGSTCLFASSCRSFQNDFPYCSMRTCSFLLCSSSSGVLLGTLRLLWRLVLVSLLLRWIFSFLLASPTTIVWSLEGLMVPIITSLSCSCVRDSMKSARLGIFQARAINFVAWKVYTNNE